MPFFEPVTLTTSRVVLRPLRHDDVPALFAIWSDVEAMRYFAFPAMTHLDQAADRIERKLKTSTEGTDLGCVVTLQTTGEAIGTCDLFRLDEQCLRAEIGFSLQRKHWGNGYMTEAVSAVIGHAFGKPGLRRIEADIDPRNTASAGLLERLGFLREGLLRERWLVGGEVSDSALYGLLARDYQSRKVSGSREA